MGHPSRPRPRSRPTGAVVVVDVPLVAGVRRDARVERWPIHHLLAALVHSHLDLVHRFHGDQKMKAPGPHVQKAYPVVLLPDVEVCHAADLLAAAVVDVQAPDVLLPILESEFRVTQLDEVELGTHPLRHGAVEQGLAFRSRRVSYDCASGRILIRRRSRRYPTPGRGCPRPRPVPRRPSSSSTSFQLFAPHPRR